MSRTENYIRNLKYSLLGQIIALVVSYFTRKVFINILGSEYLGLDGFFTNIMSVLSLSELGIGSAITYSLYKPIADNDINKIKGLMQLFKKAYICISIIVSIFGILSLPFIEYFIKDNYRFSDIKIIYVIYILNSSLSYLLSYRRSILIADQKKYVESIIHYSFFTIRNIIQILILYVTRNFILFLIIQLVFTIIQNIIITYKANKIYGYIRDRNVVKLDKLETNQIKRNVIALIFHKIGGVLVTGTDNIILSKFIGLAVVGLYSNYLILINSLNLIFSQIFQALTSSIGNLGITQTREQSYKVFNAINLAAFWLYSFSSVCLFILFNPFISMWLGNQYLFGYEIVTFIVLNYYLNGMRKSVLIFKDAFGLFWFDRYKPILECIINLLMSIILVKKIGLAGVLLGTTISILATCLWIEPFVVYKYAFNKTVFSYLYKYALYLVITIVITSITHFLSSKVEINMAIADFTIKALICLVVPNVFMWALFHRTSEYKLLKEKLIQHFRTRQAKKLAV